MVAGLRVEPDDCSGSAGFRPAPMPPAPRAERIWYGAEAGAGCEGQTIGIIWPGRLRGRDYSRLTAIWGELRAPRAEDSSTLRD